MRCNLASSPYADGVPSYIGSDKAITDLPIFGREVRRPLFRSLNFYERRFSGPAEARPHFCSGEVPV